MANGGVQRTGDSRWSPNGRQIVIAFLVALVVLLAVFNLGSTDIDFLVTTVSMPLVFVIAACTILGFAAGYLFSKHLEQRD